MSLKQHIRSLMTIVILTYQDMFVVTEVINEARSNNAFYYFRYERK